MLSWEMWILCRSCQSILRYIRDCANVAKTAISRRVSELSYSSKSHLSSRSVLLRFVF